MFDSSSIFFAVRVYFIRLFAPHTRSGERVSKLLRPPPVECNFSTIFTRNFTFVTYGTRAARYRRENNSSAVFTTVHTGRFVCRAGRSRSVRPRPSAIIIVSDLIYPIIGERFRRWRIQKCTRVRPRHKRVRDVPENVFTAIGEPKVRSKCLDRLPGKWGQNRLAAYV